MSTTIFSVIVMLLAQILPHFGVTVGSEAITTTLQTAITVAAGLWVWYKRYKTGDVTLFGAYK